MRMLNVWDPKPPVKKSRCAAATALTQKISALALILRLREGMPMSQCMYWAEYRCRVDDLVALGMTNGDAQGVLDVAMDHENFPVDWPA